MEKKSDGNKSLILKNNEEYKLFRQCQANSRELEEQKKDLESKLWDAKQLKNRLEYIRTDKENKIKTLKNRQNELMEQVQDCKSNERQTQRPTPSTPAPSIATTSAPTPAPTNYYREPTLNSNNVKLPSYSLYFRKGHIELENKIWNDRNEFLPLDLGLSDDENHDMNNKITAKSFTIEFWVKLESLSTWHPQIIRKGRYGYGLELVKPLRQLSQNQDIDYSNKATINFVGTSTLQRGRGWVPDRSIRSKEGIVELNKWQHIAVSCRVGKMSFMRNRQIVEEDGITVRFFVNGEMVGSPIIKQGNVLVGSYQILDWIRETKPEEHPLNIGKRFIGKLADLRLWRTEISPNDIRNYWQNTNLTSHPKLSTLLLNLINNPEDEPNPERCIKNGKQGVFNSTVVYQPKCIGRNDRISNSLVNTRYGNC